MKRLKSFHGTEDKFKNCYNLLEKQLILQGKILEEQNKRRKVIDELADVEFSVFSQWGEDGILSWLIQQMPLMPTNFIEFGVEDYLESNTRYLLITRNWSGLVLDSSKDNIHKIRGQSLFWRHDLEAASIFLNTDNINISLNKRPFPDGVGLLSIDIDGNDYWIWEAINQIDPWIVVIEYNAVFGDLHKLSTPYDPLFSRSVAHHSNLFFGASLPALIELGIKKGYTFVGSNSAGSNAFFIKSDPYNECIRQSLKRCTAYPSKLREARNKNGHLTFDRCASRLSQIENLGLINTSTKLIQCLRDLEAIYSDDWKHGKSVNHQVIDPQPNQQ